MSYSGMIRCWESHSAGLTLPDCRSPTHWEALSISVRGARHVEDGTECQDAWLTSPTDSADRYRISAVADGHGHRRHPRSRWGAIKAVEIAVAHSERYVSVLLEEEAHPCDETTRTLLKAIHTEWMCAVRDHFREFTTSSDLQELSDEERARIIAVPEIAYGATLLVVIVTREWWLALQLGDGDIMVVSSEGRSSLAIEPFPSIDSQTHSLCSSSPWELARSRFVPCGSGVRPLLLMLSTDGYKESFGQLGDFLEVGTDLMRAIRAIGLKRVLEFLPEHLSDISARGSGDDITLSALIPCPMR